jgi:tetratricopeptide (TPR) repeat protein
LPAPLLSAEPKPVAPAQPAIAESSGLLLPSVPPAEASTNTPAESGTSSEPGVPPAFRKRLEMARHFRFSRQPREAEPFLVDLLAESSPEPVKQRAGNEIANYLYLEGDYTRALEIYLALQQLDSQASWQLPAAYQIGLTYERLAQTEKAINTYLGILQCGSEVGTNASPGLKAVLEMARWRADFVKWQGQAEGTARAFAQASAPAAVPAPAPPSREPAHP